MDWSLRFPIEQVTLAQTCSDTILFVYIEIVGLEKKIILYYYQTKRHVQQDLTNFRYIVWYILPKNSSLQWKTTIHACNRNPNQLLSLSLFFPPLIKAKKKKRTLIKEGVIVSPFREFFKIKQHCLPTDRKNQKSHFGIGEFMGVWWAQHVIHWDSKTLNAYGLPNQERQRKDKQTRWVPIWFPTQSSTVGSTSFDVPCVVPNLIIKPGPTVPRFCHKFPIQSCVRPCAIALFMTTRPRNRRRPPHPFTSITAFPRQFWKFSFSFASENLFLLLWFHLFHFFLEIMWLCHCLRI